MLALGFGKTVFLAMWIVVKTSDPFFDSADDAEKFYRKSLAEEDTVIKYI